MTGQPLSSPNSKENVHMTVPTIRADSSVVMPHGSMPGSAATNSIVLICPGERPAVHALAQKSPLVLVPILGKPLLEHWLDHLTDEGVRHVRLLASDRPEQVRTWLSEGVHWELKVELVAEGRELTTAEARANYASNADADSRVKPVEVSVMDFLPGAPERPLFRSYVDWFLAVNNRLLQTASAPDRIGVRTLRSGVWVGLHSRISADAELRAPCWIGENVLVGPRAIVGPGTIVEDGTVLSADAEVANSIVGPGTFVGEFTEVKHSLALGSTLINWQTGSCTQVPDAFLLSPLSQCAATVRSDHWPGRVTEAPVRAEFCEVRGKRWFDPTYPIRVLRVWLINRTSFDNRP